MSTLVALRRLRWIAKGLRDGGFQDFRTIGIADINVFQAGNGMIRLEGWVYSFRLLTNRPILEVLQDDKAIFTKTINTRRSPAAESYFGNKDLGDAGIYAFLQYESNVDLSARLRFETPKGDYFLNLGTIRKNTSKAIHPRVFDPWESNQFGEIDLGYMQLGSLRPYLQNNPSTTEDIVDIIIPIYNGLELLSPLFESVKQTSLPYRLIIINDASPDSRVDDYLQSVADNADNVILIENDRNLGFVRSVNRGLSMSSNDVVILNTDSELPDRWLERLIRPIRIDETVASATPMTNSGTICSFPNFLENNRLFDGLSLKAIDEQFGKMIPLYTEVPTGVGFCMAMSRSALAKIGALDEETFGKGYGEENDWCQRAIKAGFKNVLVENLFVYHKHGGSFESDEKRALCEAHEKKLLEKHPTYLEEVACFCQADPLSQFRSYVQSALRCSQLPPVLLVFNHLLGGGANDYLEKEKPKILEQGRAIATLAFEPVEYMYHLTVEYGELSFQCLSTSLASLLSLFDDVDEVWINELVTFGQIQGNMETIRDFIRVRKPLCKILIHDYFPICPSINLLDCEGRFCGIPSNLMKCQECYKKKGFDREYGATILDYRSKWKALFGEEADVVCFSVSSEELLTRAFPQIARVIVSPHAVRPLPKVKTNGYDHDEIRIGIIGRMCEHKGASIVKSIAEHSRAAGISVVLFGDFEDGQKPDGIKVIGEYQRDELSNLVQSEEIDVIFFPSIWPETFSFTCSEAISMGLPVASFDIGAPAERIKAYDLGKVMPLDLDIEEIVDELIRHANKSGVPNS